MGGLHRWSTRMYYPKEFNCTRALFLGSHRDSTGVDEENEVSNANGQTGLGVVQWLCITEVKPRT